jgi:hypothetical protein
MLAEREAATQDELRATQLQNPYASMNALIYNGASPPTAEDQPTQISTSTRGLEALEATIPNALPATAIDMGRLQSEEWIEVFNLVDEVQQAIAEAESGWSFEFNR